MSRPRLGREILFCLLTIIAGVLLSFLVSQFVHQKNVDLLHSKTTDEVNKFSELASERIYSYQYGLRSIRGFVLAEGETLSRESFARYSTTRDINIEFPGARGFGFIRRVRPDKSNELLYENTDGQPTGLTVKQLAPHPGEQYIIQFIEPRAPNSQSIGLDIASESNRRDAALKAAKTGQVQLTGPITLVQAQVKDKQSFLILLPIYENWITPVTLEQREDQVMGWAFAPLLMEEVIQTLKVNYDYFSLKLTDITYSGSEQVFHQVAHPYPPTPYSAYTHINVFGRTWLVELDASPKFVKSFKLINPLVVFTLGLVISLSLGLLQLAVGKIIVNRAKILRQQSQLAAIVQSTDDAIIGVGLDGRVSSWNRGPVSNLDLLLQKPWGRKLPI